MDTKIHLFRHGETVWNAEKRMQGQSDSPLTATGRQQAIDARKKLDNIDVDYAYCSDSGRAKETTSLLLEELDISLTASEVLREMHFGEWEGELQDDVSAHSPDESWNLWNKPDKYQSNGGEDLVQLRDRAVDALTNIARKHRGKEVVIVSHGAFIKTVLNHIDGRPLAESWEGPYAENLCHSILSFCSDDKFSINQFCDVPR
ncbi:histidine phosphatase family protein [Veronia pacifica]|uniref:Phosphoglycerate mutase n=1 Tax=Veronia pacifica TaxID=1080227 RepID=A0A1C3E866_9GAMM|nr:histidine phosphatase family protein [Veronia pacifica]ODA29448.1 hypothetical protein A8L45_22150 [Veronia pacifica]